MLSAALMALLVGCQSDVAPAAEGFSVDVSPSRTAPANDPADFEPVSNQDQELRGTWHDHRWPGGAKITLVGNGSSTELKVEFADGSEYATLLNVVPADRGTRLDPIGGVGGDYYVLLGDGRLELRDAEGLIAVLPPAR